MHLAVVHKVHGIFGRLLTASLAVDHVGGRAEAVGHLESVPRSRDSRFHYEDVAPLMEAEDILDGRLVGPRSGTGVPGPASPARVLLV